MTFPQDKKQPYVYIWIRPDKKEPFYVGKGVGPRGVPARFPRNPHCNQIIKKCGGTKNVTVQIIPCTSHEEAFALERSLIAQFGRRLSGGPLTNLTDGGEGAVNPSPEVIEKLRAIHRRKMATDKDYVRMRRQTAAQARAYMKTMLQLDPEFQKKMLAARRISAQAAQLAASLKLKNDPKHRARLARIRRKHIAQATRVLTQMKQSDPEFAASIREELARSARRMVAIRVERARTDPVFAEKIRANSRRSLDAYHRRFASDPDFADSMRKKQTKSVLNAVKAREDRRRIDPQFDKEFRARMKRVAPLSAQAREKHRRDDSAFDRKWLASQKERARLGGKATPYDELKRRARLGAAKIKEKFRADPAYEAAVKERRREGVKRYWASKRLSQK